jgi:formyl-CoA transferase
LTAAFAIVSALADPERKAGRGKGTLIDVSMLEAVMATMGWAVSNFLVAGREPRPLGNDNVTASPSGTFRTSDGLINIAANKQEHFVSVCQVVGMPELARDPRFSEREARLKLRDDLKLLLEEALSKKSTDYWWGAFTAVGVPAGPVYSVRQALEQPQITSRGMIATFSAPPGVERDIQLVKTGFKFNGEAPSVSTPPPRLGEHNHAILHELGLSEQEIRCLEEEQVI